MPKPRALIFYAFILFFFFIAFQQNVTDHTMQQYAYLSDSFLHGRLYFLEKPGTWIDVVEYKNHLYWHMGPGPAVLLIPFMALFRAFNDFFYMGYLQILLTGGIFFLCYRLAKIYKFSHTDSLFLALAFCFGSVYVTVAFIPWSWYFAQALVTACLLLSLYEWHGKKRYVLIGLLFALIISTRVTAAFGLLFFAGDLFWKNKDSLKTNLKHLGFLLLPVAIAAMFVMSYNYARFGNVFESGYRMADNKRSSDKNRYELIHYGLFQLRNIPTNIYYYFIKTVDPVRVEHYGDFGQTYLLKPPYVRVENPGAGFFIISPVFLYIFALIKRKNLPRVVYLSLAPVITITFILMTFFWPGWAQLGPRYMLDALPFMYLMLLCAFVKSKVTLFAKLIIIISVIFNFYLLVT